MSSEITINATLSAAGLKQSYAPGAKSIDQTTKVFVSGKPSIPTTAAGTALAMGAVAGAGWAYFENADLSNYIEVGVQSGGVFYPTIKLKPSEFVAVRLASAAPFARANTAAAPLIYCILDD